jgi:hypothetical protein
MKWQVVKLASCKLASCQIGKLKKWKVNDAIDVMTI